MTDYKFKYRKTNGINLKQYETISIELSKINKDLTLYQLDKLVFRSIK